MLAFASYPENGFAGSQARDLLGYFSRYQAATTRGSNRTQVPILKQGIRPAFANLKIVIRETASNSESWAAVRARLNCSMRSGKEEELASDMDKLRDEFPEAALPPPLARG